MNHPELQSIEGTFILGNLKPTTSFQLSGQRFRRSFSEGAGLKIETKLLYDNTYFIHSELLPKSRKTFPKNYLPQQIITLYLRPHSR